MTIVGVSVILNWFDYRRRICHLKLIWLSSAYLSPLGVFRRLHRSPGNVPGIVLLARRRQRNPGNPLRRCQAQSSQEERVIYRLRVFKINSASCGSDDLFEIRVEANFGTIWAYFHIWYKVWVVFSPLDAKGVSMWFKIYSRFIYIST